MGWLAARSLTFLGDSARSAAMTATPDPEDLDALLAELEAQERELSAQRRKLHDRLASFPNELTVRRNKSFRGNAQSCTCASTPFARSEANGGPSSTQTTQSERPHRL